MGYLENYNYRSTYNVDYPKDGNPPLDPSKNLTWNATYDGIGDVTSPDARQWLSVEKCEPYIENFDWYDPTHVLTERPFLLYTNEYVLPNVETPIYICSGFDTSTITTTTVWTKTTGFTDGELDVESGTNEDSTQINHEFDIKQSGSPKLFTIYGGQPPEYAFESGTFYNFDSNTTPSGYGGTTQFRSYFNLPVFNLSQAQAIYHYLLTGEYSDAMNYEELKEKDEDDTGYDDGGGANPDNSGENANNIPAESSNNPLSCAGAMNPYAVTPAQLQNVFKWFWNGMTDELEEDNFLKYVLNAYGDLRKNIVSARMYPFNLPYTTEKPLVLGRFVDDSQILSVLDHSKQLVVEFSGDVKGKHGSFLDFAPYTNVNLYLPYYGTIQLPTNLVMRQKLRVQYYVDFTTGSLDIFVLLSTGENTNRLIQHLTCTVGQDIFYDLDSGFSSNDLVHNFGVNIVKDEVASALKGAGTGSAMSGNPIAMGVGAVAGVGGDVMSKIPDLPTTQSNLQSTLGSNGIVSNWNETACILYEDADIVDPAKCGQAGYKGYVCMKSAYKISQYDGYIEVDNPRIKFDKTVPTVSEEIEIYKLLSSGIYVNKGHL